MIYLYIPPRTITSTDNQYTIDDDNLELNLESNRKNPKIYKYLFRNVNCLGYDCFNPGEVMTYSERQYNNLLTNKSYTKVRHKKCLTMHEDGCPELCIFRRNLFSQKIQEGWRWIVI